MQRAVVRPSLLLHATRRTAINRSTALLQAPPLRSLATQRTGSSRPVLPEPLEINVRGGQYAIKYIDLKPSSPSPSSSADRTIVFIHGSPGTYQDYKYLIPLLQDHVRVVGINLPGNGDSRVLDRANYYDKIRPINLAHAAQDAIAQICAGDKNVFVVGHSFGGHAAINVAALNAAKQDSRAGEPINLRGLALLASAGLRRHRALEMGNLDLVYKLVTSDFRLVEAIGRGATRALFTRVWKFPSSASTEHYVAGLVRCASTDFGMVNDHVAQIAHLPAFFAWAKDDAFMQEEIFTELSAAFVARGPRFAFEKGGHNIQKTHAAFLADQLLQWTQRVVQGDAETTPSNETTTV